MQLPVVQTTTQYNKPFDFLRNATPLSSLSFMKRYTTSLYGDDLERVVRLVTLRNGENKHKASVLGVTRPFNIRRSVRRKG